MDQNATLLVADGNLLCINLELCEPEYTRVSIQAALEGLQKLKSVKKEEYKFLVKRRNEIESAYSELDELKDWVSYWQCRMYSIDFTSELLPTHMKFDWRRKYGDLSPNDRLQPLSFYEILRKRSAVVSPLIWK